LILLMEGAEGVRSPGELDEWHSLGVRMIGPAWMGTRFCGGTNQPGPLTADGFELLEGMAAAGLALDLSHMDEKAALQALEVYPGTILASHSNAKALLKGTDSNRHLTDRVLRGILERDGVIGVAAYNKFLLAGWQRGDRRELVSLSRVAAQIDYICQAAGDARHAGLGTDFDGGLGWQSVPHEIDTVASLQLLAPLLRDRGYTDDEIAAVLGGNWARLARQILE
jgi:membrane dipeptidase